MIRKMILLFGLLLLASGAIAKPRLIVLTDITNEPDDEQSMVRLLCYANEFDIEGLIATTSCWLRDRTAPQKIIERIEAYRKVRRNFMVHSDGWPEADTLLRTVKAGVPIFGMQGVGKGREKPLKGYRELWVHRVQSVAIKVPGFPTRTVLLPRT